MNAQDPVSLPLGIARLTDLGVIRASGDDAASFLHGQLTQDMLSIRPGQTRLAAWCSAKGRMLASFWVIRLEPNEFLLITSVDTLAATLRRLSLFVLRARVRLSDASSEWLCWGQTGSVGAQPTPPAAAAEQVSGIVRVALPAVRACTRTLLLSAADGLEPEGLRVGPEDWNALEVFSGIARITAPVSDLFVPQTVNFESVDGVHFKKGCYPGQEVVARSQFRGTVKRRGYLVTGAQPIAAGQELYSTLDPEQACGTVVMAAPLPDGKAVAFASVQVGAAEASGLHLGRVDGPPLRVSAPPYTLRDDI